jgi:haloacetate dehalogenase
LFTEEEIAVYVTAYSKPGALRGAFSDYRAGEEDVAQDEEDRDRLIQYPTLALWGEDCGVRRPAKRTEDSLQPEKTWC